MFGEAMQGMSDIDRKAFMALGGQNKIETAFNSDSIMLGAGHSGFSRQTDNTRRALDLAKTGTVSAATEIRDNTGLVKTNKQGIENAINSMSEDDRRQYEVGKALAAKQPIPAELHADKMTDAQKHEATTFYNKTHEALKGAGNASQLTKWEDEIAKPSGTIVSKLADHAGSVYNDGKSDIMKSVEGMSKSDWDDAKKHPERRDQVKEELNNLKGMRLNDMEDAR